MKCVQRACWEVLSPRSRTRENPGSLGESMRIHAKSIECVTRNIVAALLLAGMSVASEGQVRTDAGSVEGSTSTDGKVQIFKGIPYAAPPLARCAGKSRNQFLAGKACARRRNSARTVCREMYMTTWCFATRCRA